MDHSRVLHNFCRRLTADHALAEDVVQEVLIRASKRWDRLQTLDHPELYVRKMIVNVYLSSRRRNWRLLPTGTASPGKKREMADLLSYSWVGMGAVRCAVPDLGHHMPRR